MDFDYAIVERNPVKICERILARTASCVVITNFAIAIAKSLASTIKELSDQISCNTMRGTYDTMSWIYYSSSRNYDTTAQQGTIAGTIKKYLDDTSGNKLCSTRYLRTDHEGTWNERLRICPTADFKSNA
jgi:hypothetical protein